MSQPSFFVPDAGAAAPGSLVQLEADEATHVRTLRLKPGSEVIVTDGRGGRWRGELEDISPRLTTCLLVERLRTAPRPSVSLAFGVGNRDRTLWLVEKAVELGVSSLQPIHCARSRSVSDAAVSKGFWRKARRRGISALKQSGGSHLPSFRAPAPLSAYLERIRPGEEPGELRCLASIAARRSLTEIAAGRDDPHRATLLVGPEGGLEPEEVTACRAIGFVPVSLGPRTLRFETAAVAGLAILTQCVAESSGSWPAAPVGDLKRERSLR